MARVDLGNVPEWLAAGSLILAFVIFGLDRRNRSRAQVDALGVWTSVSYAAQSPPTPPGPVGEVSTTVYARNSASVPIRVLQLACVVRTVWMVADPTSSTAGPQGLATWRPKPGLDPPVRFFVGPFTVAPGKQEDRSGQYDVEHMRPQGGERLDW